MATILIIDDEKNIRKALIRNLRKAGFDLLEADGSANAFSILENNSVDLILVDQLMPEMEGIDFLKNLREKKCEIPAIMMTGYTSTNLAVTFIKAGGSDYIEKPLDIDILKIKIQRSLTEYKRLQTEIKNRKRAEDALLITNKNLIQATQIAEEALAKKETFLANVGHELRTPLNSIIGFSELLLKQYENVLDHEQTDYVNRIKSNGTHVLSIINDLLDIAKLTAGKASIQFKKCLVRECVKETMDIIGSQFLKKRQTVETSFSPSIDHFIGDKRFFKQILLNLLSNAIKYTPEHGSIKIKVERESDDFLKLSIIDTGIGIEKEDLKNIFTEFYQVSSTENNKEKGVGIGLALTKRIVEQLGGVLWVTSTVGKGSKFSFTLPLKK